MKECHKQKIFVEKFAYFYSGVMVRNKAVKNGRLKCCDSSVDGDIPGKKAEFIFPKKFV
jgi:hypothetical protein